MGLAKACFSLFRVGIGWYLWSWRRKELPVAVPPASEATSRGAEHSLLLPRFSCFRLQPTKKETPKGLFRLWSWRILTPFPYFTDNLYSSNYCFQNGLSF